MVRRDQARPLWERCQDALIGGALEIGVVYRPEEIKERADFVDRSFAMDMLSFQMAENTSFRLVESVTKGRRQVRGQSEWRFENAKVTAREEAA